MTDQLVALVRAGKLALPTQASFDPQAWLAAHAQSKPSEFADDLLASVLWFADELGVVRKQIADLALPRLDLPRLTAELCGICNLNFVHSEAHVRHAYATQPPESFPMGSAAHVKLESPAGDVGNPDAWRTGATDSAGRALQAVFAAPLSRVRSPFGVSRAAAQAFSLYNRLYVLEFYCERVAWEGWRLSRDGEAYRLSPPAPDPFGTSMVLADWRREQDLGEWTILAARAWLERRGELEQVVERASPGTGRRYVTGFRLPGENSAPLSMVLRLQFESSDLMDVADAPLPAFGDEPISLADVVRASLLIGDVARLLTDDLLALGAKAKPRQYATRLAIHELCDLLVELGWSRAKSARVVDFFTYRGASYDGLWAKPLVEAGNGYVIPILPALATPNLYRSAEIWLAEAGGEALQRVRGGRFEARARKTLRKALSGGGLTGEVVIPEPWTVKIDGARRDIDMAIRIGSTVFVGEAKLKRFPAAPRESGRWIAELKKGAAQARLRAAFLEGQPASAAQATAFRGDPGLLTFRPFVLVSGSFGAGVLVDGVPIIDLDALAEFFDPGYFGVSGDLLPGSRIRPLRTVPFWSCGEDLSKPLIAYLAEPVRIRAIEAAMMVAPRKIGLLARDGRPILIADPVVDASRFSLPQAERLEKEVADRWRQARDAHA